MAATSSSRIQVNPSFTMPETIMQINQVSGFTETLATGNPLARLSEGDLYVYARTLDIRTKVAAGQSAANQLPSVGITSNLISTPTYLVRVRAEYDHHDVSAAGGWGYSLVEANRLGMRQGFFQQFRNAALYGFNPANGEGLLSASGTTAVSLPADSYGHTTATTYDNGEMAQFFLSQIVALKQRTLQLGIGRKIVILGPQRILGPMEYNVVQLTQYQRTGAGTNSTAGLIKDVAGWSSDDITWVYDNTLEGKGAGGTDAVIITMPEIEPINGGKINTNEFAKLTPNLPYNNLQLCDMVAPREMTAPLPGGATDVTAELRMTSGWPVRPEGVTIVSMAYA